MPGQFFQGLSIGLNDEFTSQRAAKEKRNAEEKSQVLKLLGSLADQVEPESQGLLYRHIGDVIGLKGKQKGIFARLTGADLDSDQGAMQSKLQEILGTLQGPGARQAATPKPQVTSTVQGGPEGINLQLPSSFSYQGGMGPDEAQAMRQNKLYLRDPRQEELSQLRAKFGLQRDSKLAEIEERDRLSYQTRSKLQEDRQAFEASQTSIKEEDRITRAWKERAYLKASSQGRTLPSKMEEMQAAQEIERENGLKEGVLQARITTLNAQAKLAEYQTQIDPVTGQMRGKAPTEMQQKQFDQSQLDKANTIVSDFGKAKALANSLGAQAQQVFERVKALVESNRNLSYDAKKGIITDKRTGKVDDIAMTDPQIKPLLNQFALLMQKKEEALGIMRSKKQIIRDTYSTMFNVGANETDDIQMLPGVGGIAPAGAPRTSSPGPSPMATPGDAPVSRSLKIGEIWPNYPTSKSLMPGDIIRAGKGGKMVAYEVVEPNGQDSQGRNLYKIRRTR